MRSKNRLLAMFFSFVPGAGHMYLGLMRQGLELMLLFALTCLLLSLDRVFYPLLFLMPIWFAYSFFDVINKFDQQQLSAESHLDLLRWLNLPTMSWSRDKLLRWSGIGALVAGGYVAVDGFLFYSLQKYGQVWFGSGFSYWQFLSYVRTGVLAVLLILGGLTLLRFSERAGAIDDEQFDQLLPEPEPEQEQ